MSCYGLKPKDARKSQSMTSTNASPASEEAAPLLLQLKSKEGSQEIRRTCHLHTMTFRPLARPGKDEYPVGRVSTVNVVAECSDSATHEFGLASASGDSVTQSIPGGLRVVALRVSWRTVYGGELRLGCF